MHQSLTSAALSGYLPHVSTEHSVYNAVPVIQTPRALPHSQAYSRALRKKERFEIERSRSGLKTVQSNQRRARKQQQLYHRGGEWGGHLFASGLDEGTHWILLHGNPDQREGWPSWGCGLCWHLIGRHGDE